MSQGSIYYYDVPDAGDPPSPGVVAPVSIGTVFPNDYVSVGSIAISPQGAYALVIATDQVRALRG